MNLLCFDKKARKLSNIVIAYSILYLAFDKQERLDLI